MISQGNFYQRVRKKRAWTKYRAAKETGMDQSSWHFMEVRNGRIGLDVLADIVRVADLSGEELKEWLLTHNGKPRKPEKPKRKPRKRKQPLLNQRERGGK